MPNERLNGKVIVIGGGMGGLISAIKAAKNGFSVELLTEGMGATAMSLGGINIAGKIAPDKKVESPKQGLQKLVNRDRKHTYEFGLKPELTPEEKTEKILQILSEEITWLIPLLSREGYSLKGSLERNMILLNALGGLRTVCFAPQSFAAGNLLDIQPNTKAPMDDRLRIGIIKIKSLQDFYPQFIREGLLNYFQFEKQVQIIEMDEQMITGERIIPPSEYALLLDTEDFRELFLDHVSLIDSRGFSHLGFPAILGLKHTEEIQQEIEQLLNVKIFEIPTAPPTIIGQRLIMALEQVALKAGVNIHFGVKVVSAKNLDIDYKPQIISIDYLSIVEEKKTITGDYFILATGNAIGGGITTEKEEVIEPIFRLGLGKVTNPVEKKYIDSTETISDSCWENSSNNSFIRNSRGIEIDHQFKPKQNSRIIATNLFACGALLNSHYGIEDHCGMGAAIFSAIQIINHLKEDMKGD
ncbi:MAG: FAD-binding protein [Candidatus Heimdallarchaeota archaeon]|nr:FAD-binding protein [Candidatus Heimdallarchaeota archaeon]